MLGKKRKIEPWDFEILRVVGKGTFGKVFQVKKSNEDENGEHGDGIYVMKVVRETEFAEEEGGGQSLSRKRDKRQK